MTIKVAKASVLRGTKLERPKVQISRPPLKVYDKVKNPFEGKDFEGSYEENAKVELSETLKAFKEAMKRDDKRFVNTTDSAYWACLVFEDRVQKEVFLKALGLKKGNVQYVDGRELADVMGIELPKADGIVYNDGTKGNRTRRQ